jgi:hypothetical protein
MNHKYVKILHFGHASLQDLLRGPVIIQEKIDGSQFRFGLDLEGKFFFGSKNKDMYFDSYESMFHLAVAQMERIKDRVGMLRAPITFFGEFLKEPKHGALAYDRVPQNHITLFDVVRPEGYYPPDAVQRLAEGLGFEVAPLLWAGDGSGVDMKLINYILTRPSLLGGPMIEGMVIKNYNQQLLFGGTVQPVFGKYVSEKYKEKHQKESYKYNPRQGLDGWIEGFRSENRWDKVVRHMLEDGELEGAPRDIGKLIKAVQNDLIEEEKENIKAHLYKIFKDQITRRAVQGLPEWYKQRLAQQQFTEDK